MQRASVGSDKISSCRHCPLADICRALSLNPNKSTPGREVVHHTGAALVQAMKMALDSGKREAEERHHVKTAIGVARAQQSRTKG